jgi:hypothetical protein
MKDFFGKIDLNIRYICKIKILKCNLLFPLILAEDEINRGVEASQTIILASQRSKQNPETV